MGKQAAPTNSSIAIGMRLRNWREKKGHSVAKIAADYNISRSTWYLMEVGKTLFDSEDLFDLANFMEVTPEYLLTGKEFPSQDGKGFGGTSASSKLLELFKMQNAFLSALLSYQTDVLAGRLTEQQFAKILKAAVKAVNRAARDIAAKNQSDEQRRTAE